ncbi:winged helix-turn-helix domain-containing protein [Halopiger aswanensis]|uniref:Helix-turn-helix protein n=1 Tax=Halopiger aswanensis TaxID=148449 RepID=A0A3R7GUS3_9EURY|nr:helix-turn-helix domain-containing protein [Halopiger aswanensis]RKD93815.1 helix-turn-helix protein [Halopiger aswanensis]
MSREGQSIDRAADPGRVIDALEDDACCDILAVLEEPMTVKEIAAEAEVPLSTTYKKVDRLTDTSLVGEEIQLRPGGHHRSQYVARFERLAVEFDEHRNLQVEIERPPAKSERERESGLSELWSSVRETAETVLEGGTESQRSSRSEESSTAD